MPFKEVTLVVFSKIWFTVTEKQKKRKENNAQFLEI